MLSVKSLKQKKLINIKILDVFLSHFLVILYFLIIPGFASAVGIPFYKNQNSLFPSGHLSLETLRENLLESSTENRFVLNSGSEKFKIDSTPVISAFDVSRFWIETQSKKKVTPKTHLPLSEVISRYQTDPYDMGLILTTSATDLKVKPDSKSESLFQIPNQTKFLPLRFEKGFAKVMYQKKYGYIDLNKTLSKFDFARFAYSSKEPHKSWQTIRNREFDILQTSTGSSLLMGLINGLVVDEKLVFSVTQTESEVNSSKNRTNKLHIVNEIQKKNWNKSHIKGHGLVYWKTSQNEDLRSLTIDELLKQEIYSVSFLKSNPKKGIASTKLGVFLTHDGQNWSELSQFRNYAGPVFYYNDKIIFVGEKRSFNAGQTFETYFDVSQISHKIQTELGLNPKKIKITQIKIIKPLKLSIDLDLGTKKIRLHSPIYAQDWSTQNL